MKLFCPVCGKLTEHHLEELKGDFRFGHDCGAYFWIEDSIFDHIDKERLMENRKNNLRHTKMVTYDVGTKENHMKVMTESIKKIEKFKKELSEGI